MRGVVENYSNYCVLDQSYVYEKYVKYAESEGHPFHSWYNFYKRNKELNFEDIKEDGGICTDCTVIGNKKWNKLRTEIWFLYSVTDEKQQLKTILIDEFQLHFNRGGRFYQSYALSSGCIDWCMKYQL